MPDSTSIGIVGTGKVGSAIAAMAANGGCNVVWTGQSHEGLIEALYRLKGSKPTPFHHSESTNRIGAVPFDEFLLQMGSFDFVFEATSEDLDSKRAVLSALDAHIGPDTILASTNLALPLEALATGLSEANRRRFFGVRFHLPARQRWFAELVAVNQATAEARTAFETFLVHVFGRRFACLPDGPGSGPWRLWVSSCLHALQIGRKLQLRPHQIDQATRILGMAHRGVCEDMDHFGLDTFARLAANLRDLADPNAFPTSPELDHMVENGWFGDAGRQGFFRRETAGEPLVFDSLTRAYREGNDCLEVVPGVDESNNRQNIRLCVESKSVLGEFARQWIAEVVRKAVEWRSGMAYSASDADQCFTEGLGWSIGPFQVVDVVASEMAPEAPFFQGSMTRVFGNGYAEPVDPKGCIRLHTLAPIDTGHGWAVGRTENFPFLKIGPFEKGVLTFDAIAEMGARLAGFGDEVGFLFCSGHPWPQRLDLPYLLKTLESDGPDQVEELLQRFDDLCDQIAKRCRATLIDSSCHGVGLSLALSAPVAVFHVETEVGLTSIKDGVIPIGLGACLLREAALTRGPRLAAELAARAISGETASNATLAKDRGLIRPTDLVCLHPDLLVHTALDAQPETVAVWTPAPPVLSGMIDRLQEELRRTGRATDHDVALGDLHRSCWVREQTLDGARKASRRAFVQALGKALTQARVRAIAETGKPLRN